MGSAGQRCACCAGGLGLIPAGNESNVPYSPSRHKVVGYCSEVRNDNLRDLLPPYSIVIFLAMPFMDEKVNCSFHIQIQLL